MSSRLNEDDEKKYRTIVAQLKAKMVIEETKLISERMHLQRKEKMLKEINDTIFLIEAELEDSFDSLESTLNILGISDSLSMDDE